MSACWPSDPGHRSSCGGSYKTKAGVLNGIDSIKRNAANSHHRRRHLIPRIAFATWAPLTPPCTPSSQMLLSFPRWRQTAHDGTAIDAESPTASRKAASSAVFPLPTGPSIRIVSWPCTRRSSQAAASIGKKSLN